MVKHDRRAFLRGGMVAAAGLAAAPAMAKAMTADDLLVDGSINAKQIPAGCITPNVVRSADAGARIVTERGLIRVFDSNGTERVRLGSW